MTIGPLNSKIKSNYHHHRLLLPSYRIPTAPLLPLCTLRVESFAIMSARASGSSQYRSPVHPELRHRRLGGKALEESGVQEQEGRSDDETTNGDMSFQEKERPNKGFWASLFDIIWSVFFFDQPWPFMKGSCISPIVHTLCM